MKFSLRTADIVLIGVLAIVLGFLFHRTYSFAPPLLLGYPGDAFFPRLVIGFTFLWAAIIVGRGAIRLLAERNAGNDGIKAGQMITLEPTQLVVGVSAVLAYSLLLKTVGFEILTVLLLSGFLTPRYAVAMTRARATLLAAIVSGATVLVLYVVFVLFLNVDLPLLFLPRFVQF